MEQYNEVEHLIKKLEINKRARVLQDNRETLDTYWNIGRLIVEAQGGKERAKYGDNLIKEWSKKLIVYGTNYKMTSLKYFRLFYLTFRNGQPLADQLSWSHYQELLPIKDENKRNYYINLCITNSLSKRKLREEIKNKSYERLLEKREHIEIINNKEEIYNIKEHIKNPIIIKLSKEEQIKKEKELQLIILSKLKDFFMELGYGYAYIENEYKIKINNKIYRIDILLFNYNLNAFVVVELKMRELKKEDKAQIEFYMEYIDNNLKRSFHNKTIGIIITKEQDKFILSFVSQNNIIPITYKVKS